MTEYTTDKGEALSAGTQYRDGEDVKYIPDEIRLSRWHYHGNTVNPERFKTINDATRELARLIMTLTPPSRNQSLALTHLEDVRMRANSAIAVDEQYL